MSRATLAGPRDHPSLRHPPPPAQPPEPSELRSVLGRFATGVTVVTAASPEGAAVGLTANAFTSVSLDPPLVLVCLGRASRRGRAVQEAGSFAVNILSRDQQDVCRTFADRGRDRFAGLPTATGRTGAPLITGSLAHLDCRLHEALPGGDHVILLGRVVEAAAGPDAEPLVFYRGSYR